MRSALVTNSSISLPTWRVMPRMIVPAATLSATACATRSSNVDRIEEALDQADVIVGERRIEPVDRLGQHRVAEAVDHVRELGDDRRIDRGVEAVGHDEDVDIGLDLAGELFEHEMLVLHLGAELRSLEQAFAVPDESGDLRPVAGSAATSTTSHSFRKARSSVGEDDLLGVLDQAVVLGMEDMVDGGQADVLVDAAVAGDEVRVEQLVVIVRSSPLPGLPRPIVDVAIGDLADRARRRGRCRRGKRGRCGWRLASD